MTMPKKFLAIGECMVELAQTGPDTYRRGFAGDTFNTAWYARKMLPQDWQVGYASAIGTDAASTEMAEFIKSQNIDTGSIRTVADRSVGLYMISIDNGERSFSYWRSMSAARTLADDPQWLSHAFSGCSVCYFSGITLAILPQKARENLSTALAEARENGSLIAFDTNLRPRLWESEKAMREGIDLGASVSDIVLPSLDEEKMLVGSDAPGDAIERYSKLGARVVAAKGGGSDLLLWDQETGERLIQARKIASVVDTTAAGDSFAAAFLAGIATGKSLDDSARQAMELASRVIQAPGALVPSIFD